MNQSTRVNHRKWNSLGYGFPPGTTDPEVYAIQTQPPEQTKMECDIARWEELFNQQNAKIDALQREKDEEKLENQLKMSSLLDLNTKMIVQMAENKQKEGK